VRGGYGLEPIIRGNQRNLSIPVRAIMPLMGLRSIETSLSSFLFGHPLSYPEWSPLTYLKFHLQHWRFGVRYIDTPACDGRS
jgi:hypothetical protein